MHLNADFSKFALVPAGTKEWIQSPEPGVDRIMLDRIGDEVARATSIVRYAQDSSFARHEHALGEEFLVLEGVFSDEHGDYPQGTYVRNPPGSGHVPFSKAGCRILVKLRQFEPQDLAQFSIDTTNVELWSDSGAGQVQKLNLHSFGTERVQMWRMPAGTDYTGCAPSGGIEIFLVKGSLQFEQEKLLAESWLRMPSGDELKFLAREDAWLWIKSGHLPMA